MTDQGVEGAPTGEAPSRRRSHARFPVYLPARCRLGAAGGGVVELQGKTRNLSESGTLLLLPRPLVPTLSLTVELDSHAGPAARPGQVKWIGGPESSPMGGLLVPHGVAFERALERGFVEAAFLQARPPDARAPIEVRVDYETVLSGRSVNLSKSGIFVRTGTPLPVNRLIGLPFRLPGLPEEFRIQGEVVWSNPRPGKTFPQGMGIRFLDLPPELGEQVAAFVAGMRQQLGLDRLSDLFGRPLEEENGEPAP